MNKRAKKSEGKPARCAVCEWYGLTLRLGGRCIFWKQQGFDILPGELTTCRGFKMDRHYV